MAYATTATITLQVKIMPEVNRDVDDICEEVAAACEAAALEFGPVVAAGYELGDGASQFNGGYSLPGADGDNEGEVSPPHLSLVPPLQPRDDVLPNPFAHDLDRQARILSLVGLELDEVS